MAQEYAKNQPADFKNAIQRVAIVGVSFFFFFFKYSIPKPD